MAKKKTSSSTSKKRKTNARSSSTRGGTRKRSSRKKTSRSRRKPRTRKKTQREIRLGRAQKVLLVGLLTVCFAILLFLSLISPNQGQLTSGLSSLLWVSFGWGSLLVPFITGGVGLYLVMWAMDQQPHLPIVRLIGFLLLFVTFEAFASQFILLRSNTFNDVWAIAQAQTGGGYLGGFVTYGLTGATGNLGAVFTLMVVAAAGGVMLFDVSREDVSRFVQFLNQTREAATPDEEPERNILVNNGKSTRTIRRGEPDQPVLPIEESPTPAANTAVEPEERKPIRIRRKTTPKKKKKEAPETASAPTVVSPVFLGNNGRAGSHNWQLPTLGDILQPGTDMDPTGTIIREQVEIIEHTLESFGAPATVVEINQGPTITQFGVEPSFLEMRNGKRTKVKVGKIAGLADDLTLALRAEAIRIQAPVPGKGYVGIEVPNPTKALVSLRDVMETTAFQKIKSPLRVGLGQDVAGQPIVGDLAKMPHLLIAGATGAGKSVCVNGIIACLLLQNTPDRLKLVMVDPKRVELTGYNGIPHLAAPVVVEMDRVIGVLQWAMREMDSRYKMFAEIGARNITDYNKKVSRKKDYDPLPYIVIIIDELADLMMMSPEETERGVTRLAQLARATGMHMIIATQRPSVDVVTGLIKANFPARVAFAVASGTDSRVILDATGAERLLGQGDMLFQAPDAATPVRAQGCFVSDTELSQLIAYWQAARRFNLVPAEESIRPKTNLEAAPAKTEAPASAKTTPEEQAAPTVTAPVVNMKTNAPTAETEVPTVPAPKKEDPAAKPAAKTASGQQPLWEALQEIENEPPELEDELMPEAIALVRKLNRASTSLLQRRFRIGYTRAARMIDAMEEMEIIGPPTGTSKAREVLLPPVEEESPNSEEEEEEEAQQA